MLRSLDGYKRDKTLRKTDPLLYKVMEILSEMGPKAPENLTARMRAIYGQVGNIILFVPQIAPDM